MNLLAIDTSTEAQVVGLAVGDRLIDRTERVGREHSQRILPTIQDILRDAGVDKGDLDAIVFGQGPGSFTGLRIAVGVVQGLAYGLQIPAVPVSTLACLAQGAFRRLGAREIVVALDARKTEVFFGSYQIVNGVAALVGEECVTDVSKAPRQSFNSCFGVGSGWQFRDALAQSIGVPVQDVELDVLPNVEDLLVLGRDKFKRGEVVSAPEARPQYLREKVASKPVQ